MSEPPLPVSNAAPAPQGPRARARKHDWIDERSLALAHAVARHVRADRSLIATALETLNRWEVEARASHDGRVLTTLALWRESLTTGTLDEIIASIAEDSDRARWLRQSSPFAGCLPENERLAIFARFEAM
jgi:hypothetical protein